MADAESSAGSRQGAGWTGMQWSHDRRHRRCQVAARHSARWLRWDHWGSEGLERDYIPAGIDSGTRREVTAVDAQELARLQESSIDSPLTPNSGTVGVVTRVASLAVTLSFSRDNKGTNAPRGPRRSIEGRIETARHGTVATGRMLVPDREGSPSDARESVG